MSRQIQFRGKTLSTNKWIYGSLLLLGNTTYIVENNKADLSPQGCILHEVKKESVGQLAASTPKEIDIYEGDIVKYILQDDYDKKNDYTELVAYDTGFWVAGDSDSDTHIPLYIAIEFNCEVIGNITDNPELLTA